jgi:tRNA threonylcarbamoyladenosine biosynthesis protein TsaE
MDVEFNLSNIRDAARLFLSAIADKKVFAFHGVMGAGKTTLITAICNELKIESKISSPTYSIINEYISKDGNSVLHLDLYRLETAAEAINAGVEEALYSGNLCMVEWPEKAAAIFPADTIHCYLTSIDHNTRKLQINL